MEGEIEVELTPQVKLTFKENCSDLLVTDRFRVQILLLDGSKNAKQS
jgi:hypothetical protein